MIKLVDKPNTEAPSSDFPFGNIKDKIGSNPGTPVNKLVYGDMHQFFEKLMSVAGITANGLPESDYAGYQLMDALVGVFGGLRRKVFNIGSWNMNADQDKTVTTDIPFADTRLVSFTIFGDNGSFVISAGGILSVGTDVSGNLQIEITRTTGSIYDSSGFENTGINRGYVVVDYAAESF